MPLLQGRLKYGLGVFSLFQWPMYPLSFRTKDIYMLAAPRNAAVLGSLQLLKFFKTLGSWVQSGNPSFVTRVLNEYLEGFLVPLNNSQLKKDPRHPAFSLTKSAAEKQRNVQTPTVPFYSHNRHQRNVLMTTKWKSESRTDSFSKQTMTSVFLGVQTEYRPGISHMKENLAWPNWDTFES